jgi:hypothetical protein
MGCPLLFMMNKCIQFIAWTVKPGIDLFAGEFSLLSMTPLIALKMALPGVIGLVIYLKETEPHGKALGSCCTSRSCFLCRFAYLNSTQDFEEFQHPNSEAMFLQIILA